VALTQQAVESGLQSIREDRQPHSLSQGIHHLKHCVTISPTRDRVPLGAGDVTSASMRKDTTPSWQRKLWISRSPIRPLPAGFDPAAKCIREEQRRNESGKTAKAIRTGSTSGQIMRRPVAQLTHASQGHLDSARHRRSHGVQPHHMPDRLETQGTGQPQGGAWPEGP